MLSILMFLGLTFAFWIATLTESYIIGFASATGLFILILGGFLFFGRGLVQDSMIREVIKESMKDLEESDN